MPDAACIAQISFTAFSREDEVIIFFWIFVSLDDAFDLRRVVLHLLDQHVDLADLVLDLA